MGRPSNGCITRARHSAGANTHGTLADGTDRSVSIALGRPDDPPVLAPVAVKLYSDLGSVWLVAAAPRDPQSVSAHLSANDVWVGHDEVIVVFDDAIAERIGLIEAVSIGSRLNPL